MSTLLSLSVIGEDTVKAYDTFVWSVGQREDSINGNDSESASDSDKCWNVIIYAVTYCGLLLFKFIKCMLRVPATFFGICACKVSIVLE